jgi:serine/threonine protein kinase
MEFDWFNVDRNSFGPIRWMAPGSLRDKVYSKKSDVWSFGIVGKEEMTF